ncbi:hypothetical protein J4421_02190 [Candidatus Woesearchaeota archaeon]|nr:hypothetical protein [Candidatus Woesearchaeota archaeon]
MRSTLNFWEAYDNLPKRLHHKCGKETGETSQVESVNNVIRQRLGRYVRKTCSFSKSTVNHIKVTGLFLQEYNQKGYQSNDHITQKSASDDIKT